MSMQTFYTSLFAPQSRGKSLASLFTIARASLKDILTVRSELVWDDWSAR